jgi:hypothetical protein
LKYIFELRALHRKFIFGVALRSNNIVIEGRYQTENTLKKYFIFTILVFTILALELSSIVKNTLGHAQNYIIYSNKAALYGVPRIYFTKIRIKYFQRNINTRIRCSRD